ncbi:hypothetical protein K7432_008536 [Basidiobolus ranarum]|uniref:Uncharacterized protein n=1 Tax=Basidiobolus ranarum TaxID=34480 RepID=A0ABR2WRR0_9FUNG
MSKSRKGCEIFHSEREEESKSYFPSKQSILSFQNHQRESDRTVEHFDFELVDEKFMWDTPHENDNLSGTPISITEISSHVNPTSLFLHSGTMPPSEMSELTTSSESHTNSDEEGEGEGEGEIENHSEPSTTSDNQPAASDWIKNDPYDDENIPEIDDIDPDFVHSLSDIEPSLVETPIPNKKRSGWLKLILSVLPIFCAILLIQMPDSTLDILLTTLEQHGLFPSLKNDYLSIAPQKLTERVCLAPASPTYSYMFLSECFREECEVIVVAKDLQGNPKTAGGDTFTATEINLNKDQYNITLPIYDIGNGRYLVNVPRPNKQAESIVQVTLAVTMKEISNSPLTVLWPADKTEKYAEVASEGSPIKEGSIMKTEEPEVHHQEDTLTLPDVEIIPDIDPMSIPSELNAELHDPPTPFVPYQKESQTAADAYTEEPTQLVESTLEQNEDIHTIYEHDKPATQQPVETTKIPEDVETTETQHTSTEQFEQTVKHVNKEKTCPIYSLNCHLRHLDIATPIKGAVQSALSIRSRMRNNIMNALSHLNVAFDKRFKSIAGNSLTHIVEARRFARDTLFNGVNKVRGYTQVVGRIAINWRQQTRKSFSVIGDRIKRLFRRN